MGKSAIRILPPLVNGKLSGYLEFGIDYVEITEKRFKNEDCNFLVQIIWWGETKPLFLRPNKCKFITKDNKQVIADELDGCSVKYEVRTKIKFFRLYLTKCEELELAILDSSKNEVIGCTILKNLIYLVYNTDCFIKSIISDSGDAIGKIKCHFKFSETYSVDQTDKVWKTENNPALIKKCNNNDLKINLNLTELYLTREDLLGQYDTGRTTKESISGKNVHVHYNSPVTRVSGLTLGGTEQEHLSDRKVKNCLLNPDSDQLEKSPKKLENYPEKDVKCSDSENMSSKTPTHEIPKENKSIRPKANIRTRKEEEITNRTQNARLKNSAKLINKKMPVNKVKGCVGNKFPKSKPVTSERTVRGVKKDKGNPADTAKAKNSAIVPKCNKSSNPVLKSMMKPISSVKTFGEVSDEISTLNKLYLKVESHDDNSDLENLPVKENVKDIPEESTAETNETLPVSARITSPCEHSHSARDVENAASDNVSNENREKINVNNKLFFNLNNPIEKLYYETFFRKTETLGNNEFEIAELLNQPGNNYILEANSRDGSERGGNHLVENTLRSESEIHVKSLSADDVRQKESSSNVEEEEADGGYSCSDRKSIIPPRTEVEFEGCNHESEKSRNVKEYKANCYRCKYYKKLSELDKIIDALKNFETKLRAEVRNDSKTIFRGDHRECETILPAEIVPPSENAENSDRADFEINANGSDYSKEDSDFVEFRHYLCKR